LRRVLVWSRRHRRGSPTVEFIMLVPFFILCLLLLWQLVILGMAVMHTQAAVRDVARVMALTNNEEQARTQAGQSFPDMESYRKEHVWIETKDGQAQVKIKTEVDLVLFQVPYRFYLEEQASAPIIKKVRMQKVQDHPIIGNIP
jgi:Flp pilus assembly protein TadG